MFSNWEKCVFMNDVNIQNTNETAVHSNWPAHMLATKCTYSSINKYEELKAYIYEKKPDIILITETYVRMIK